MKKYLFICLSFSLVFPLFAQHQDCVLWYKQASQNWNEALPLGNGRLGAMVFGGYPRETIQLNEESLWAGCKSEANADAATKIPEIQKLLIDGEIAKAVNLSEIYLKSNPLRIRSYQSFGNIYIDFITDNSSSVKTTNYRRELNLETGISTVSYEADGVHYKREVFVSAPDDVTVIKFSADKSGKLTFRLMYNRDQDAIAYPISNNELEISGQIVDLPDKEMGEGGLHMKFAGFISAFNKGGKITSTSNSFYVENADEVVFYFTAKTDYNFSKLNFDRDIEPKVLCKNILDKVCKQTFEQIRNKHIDNHSAIFNKLSFNMGEKSDLPTDERLKLVKEGNQDLSLVTLFFQYGRYLLMNSSRLPGILPANLQGIWNKDMYAPWSSDFHTNINIQMNYWLVETCNLSESFMPFSNLINALREPGRVTAHKTYNSKGWTMNHLSDPFGRTAISDGVGWGTFPIAGSWLVLHQWEHFLFTKDKEYLKKDAYPSMAEAAEFILSYLTEDSKGYLVTAPSCSPENRYKLPSGETFQLTYGSTMDIQIINELFDACLQAENYLGMKSELQKQILTAQKKLPPIRIGKRYNTIQEWIEDYEEVEPGHRHMSHLFGLYPGTTINPKNKELLDAARRTIERRRLYNEDEKTRNGSYTGWSRAWLINFYARLQDGKEAGDNVQKLLAYNTQSNLFSTHPPFQIDGNFGGVAGIAEMLIQSHNGEIHLLPALPPFWRNGEVKGLCARNGFVVDIKWENGELTSAKIQSKERGKVSIRYKNHLYKAKTKPTASISINKNELKYEVN